MKSAVEAIIISSLNLGEADKLVTFFSLERGKLRGTAKNARRSFKRFGAGLEPFTHCRLQLFEREHQELLRIESCDIIGQPKALTDDLERLAAGSVMLELVREVAPEAERNAAAFQLLVRTLQFLNDSDDPLFLLRIFEIKFLSLLGFQPRLDRCLSCGKETRAEVIFHGIRGGVLCPDCLVSSGEPTCRLSAGSVGFYYQALRMEMDKVSRLKPSPAILDELERVFSDHRIHLIGKKLKSTEFLQSLREL
jgi:DNA repair protein RecO (recombination protein O)